MNLRTFAPRSGGKKWACSCQWSVLPPSNGAWCQPIEYGNESPNRLSYRARSRIRISARLSRCPDARSGTRATGARAIVVYHLDRFARDLAGTLDYLRRFSRRGVELHVVGRGRVEADTASGFIVTAVEGLAAEHYRRVISEKTRDALARLRAKGRRFSRWAPYGHRFGPGGRLLAVPREQAALREIVRLRATGLSLRAISRALAARGTRARNGRPFAARTLSRLVTNSTVSHNIGA